MIAKESSILQMLVTFALGYSRTFYGVPLIYTTYLFPHTQTVLIRDKLGVCVGSLFTGLRSKLNTKEQGVKQ